MTLDHFAATLVPITVLVAYGETHAYYEPFGSAAGWWTVTLISRPEDPPYVELTPSGGST